MIKHILLCAMALLWASNTIAAQASGPDASVTSERRQWITEMKNSPRGPFARIRWFCEDGSILPPKPYACADHGGGVQHGEWSQKTQELRADGYLVANLLADLDPKPIVDAPGYSDTYNQILIEKFLVAVDDGWILRQARFYRGAFQAEDEAAGARRLLLGLAQKKDWINQGFLPLRSGANLLDHGNDSATILEIRQESLSLSQKDSNFMSLRIKIHNQPDADDARRVREYAAKINDPQLAAEYEQLAHRIDTVYAASMATDSLTALMKDLPPSSPLAQAAQETLQVIKAEAEAFTRYKSSAQLLARMRYSLPEADRASVRMQIIDTSWIIEKEHFKAASELRQQLAQATRLERLKWLRSSTYALYGAGLISQRQLEDLKAVYKGIQKTEIPLRDYKKALDYLGRVPAWGGQWMRFHFYESEEKLSEIEPLARRFMQDQLRGSPLLFYSEVVGSLQQDANKLSGLRQELFGKEVGGGLQSLNPGLSRGRLRLGNEEHIEKLDANGIYLLPETVAELPPIAGILTMGSGNPLSHVQLLARNLGIPNVGVDLKWVPTIRSRSGQAVILAVSPGGAVNLAQDQGQLDHLFNEKKTSQETVIRPDLTKLDLKTRRIMPLDQVRAADSGRIVGPKAGNLGELRHSYPEAVANGLVIPFGVFRQLLDQPLDDRHPSVYQWMVSQYDRLQQMPAGSSQRKEATEVFRQQLEQWILHADPGMAFRNELRSQMENVFGLDGSYGVFVRSDTNVEDLPNFTGAGLNLTLPNVVGFDNVLRAISKVWASPFTRRAFSWRQAHMEDPEHVYASILLLQSVNSEKSGVMVTYDVDNGDWDWLTVAINQGVGGAVDGQAAESLRIDIHTGQTRMMDQATARWRRAVETSGGVSKKLVTDLGPMLSPDEIQQLIQFAQNQPTRFPFIKDAEGMRAPADVEFGFVQGRLQLFQMRPFNESAWARSNQYLRQMDKDMNQHLQKMVDLNKLPTG
jgi:hypothetical protein